MQYETKKRSTLAARATGALAVIVALTMAPQVAAETTTPEPEVTESLAPVVEETEAPEVSEPEAAEVEVQQADDAEASVDVATDEAALDTELGATAPANAVPVYRFWSEKFGSHFYTVDVNERNAVVEKWPGTWSYEKVAFGAYKNEVPGTKPVYRFWSELYKTHFYTISEEEKNTVLEKWPNDWTLEGVAYWAFPVDAEADWLYSVERFWSQLHGSHFFTINKADKDAIRTKWSDVWDSEGARFQVVTGPAAAAWPEPKLSQRDQWKQDAGIARSNWTYVDYIVQRESGWNPNAMNPRSGACGLVQIMPIHTEAYRTCKDPVANLRWADGYAKNRYGSWEKAYNFWTRNHWW